MRCVWWCICVRMRVGTIWLDALAVRALTGLTLVEKNTRTRSTEHPDSQRIWCRFRVDLGAKERQWENCNGINNINPCK